MNKNAFEAVVFDLDGVITKTAATHSRAWKKMFDEYLWNLAENNGDEFIEFTPQDYLIYVDGKPRYEGVKSFLQSRNITLPFGDPSDKPESETVCGLGNRKNNAFNDVLTREGVEVYPSTVELLEQLKKDNIRIGVASSSKNAKSVLEAAGLMHFIETRVDGVVSAEIGLNGKPAPDIFLTAAENLGVDPNKTIVVEDATSGVRAGKNGNFGLVLGLAREDNIEALKANGADIVVEDLEEITLEEINNWFKKGIDNDNWELKYNDYIPEKEKSREALLAVGNGYFGTRGAMEESSSGESNNPGTYIAGLYNRLITKVAERDIENEDFVCAPNWLSLSFKVDDDPWLDINSVNIESIERVLDFRTGLLKRVMVITDEADRKTRIESSRIASMAVKHQAALRYSITPLNYSGQITFCSKLDGSIINEGVKRYSDLNQQHLVSVDQGNENDITWIKVKTVQSEIDIVEASKVRVTDSTETQYAYSCEDGVAYIYIDCMCDEGKSLTLEKLTSIYDSNNIEGNIQKKTIAEVAGMKNFDNVLGESKKEWDLIWNRVDIKLVGDRLAQKMLRLHIYHLIVSASPLNKDIDAGITARGLHGEAYRGHIFWDELFILPFYDIHFPDTAKSMLMYRYNRLEKAREYAKEYGYKGAMFPWQSGSDGREETQIIHLNPVSGEWGDDYSSLQRHVSLAVAYNIYQYMHVTEDKEFIDNYGAEMFIEICRFWESKSELNPETGKYSIDKVMGPDEFHESYPESHEGGLRDNAYTNIMASWMFGKSETVIDFLSDDARGKLYNKLEYQLLEKEKEEKKEIEKVKKMKKGEKRNNKMKELKDKLTNIIENLEIEMDKFTSINDTFMTSNEMKLILVHLEKRINIYQKLVKKIK